MRGKEHCTVTGPDQIVQHILPFEANIPLDRSSVFGRATYDLTDNINAYAQVLNVSSKTRRFFTDSPAWICAPQANSLPPCPAVSFQLTIHSSGRPE